MRFGRVRTSDGRIISVTEDDGHSLRVLKGDPLVDAPTVGDAIEGTYQWLPPVDPRMILCIGKNYAAHAKEMDSEAPEYPVLFIKNLSAATGHDCPVVIPNVCDDEIDYEGEMAVIIGKEAKNVSEANALDHVAAYTCANDISARIWQKDKGGSQWNRGKGFDTFAPMGPFAVTRDALPDPQVLTLTTRLNGEVMQQGDTSNMIFTVARLIAFLSQDTTLLPGTVILTGTPDGVGWARDPKVTLQPGDSVEVEISGIGTLRNRVSRAE